MESSPIYTIIITVFENAKENKKYTNETKLLYSRAENNQRIKGNEEKVCRFVCWKMFIVN
jgi:hypothetical protein